MNNKVIDNDRLLKAINSERLAKQQEKEDRLKSFEKRSKQIYLEIEKEITENQKDI